MHNPRSPVKAHGCVSFYMDVEGPVVVVLKALLYSCNLQKGEKKRRSKHRNLDSKHDVQSFQKQQNQNKSSGWKRENVLTTKVHKLTPWLCKWILYQERQRSFLVLETFRFPTVRCWREVLSEECLHCWDRRAVLFAFIFSRRFTRWLLVISISSILSKAVRSYKSEREVEMNQLQNSKRSKDFSALLWFMVDVIVWTTGSIHTSLWSFLFSAFSSSSTFSELSAAALYLDTCPSSLLTCQTQTKQFSFKKKL